jgi:tetratricopeptide (TPR) repeat protein
MVRLRVALLLTACLFVPLRSHAQRRVSLVGNVYFGDDSHPAANISVSLDNTEGGHFATEATNDAGQFRFGNLKPATYVLKVDEAGYEPVGETIDANLSSDKDIKIYLRPTSKNLQSGKGSTISVHELSLPTKAREFMESGKKKLYQDKNPAAGLADFQQAISSAPGYYEAYYQAGMSHLALGNHPDAEKNFRKSIELSGDKYGEADVGVGAVMLDRGSFPDAEKVIRHGLQLNPNFWLGHYELGRALLNERRLPEAALSASQARLLAPNAPVVYRLLSNIHLAQKDFPALIEDIDAYLALDPDSPAGVRAKELRDQLQQKLSSEHLAPTSTKP